MLEGEFDDYLHRYKADRTICHEGEEGGSFFLIKEGLAQVSYEHEDGKTVTLNTLGPGDVFGEMALLGDSSVRSATVRSETDLHCWKFSEEKFEALLETSDTFRQQVMKLLTDRLRQSNRRLVDVRELQQLLYRCSFLLVDLIDRLGPAETAQKTLAPGPSLRILKSWFDVSRSRLVTLLKNSSLEDLGTLPEPLQDQLLETAQNLIQQGLNQLTLRVHPPEKTEDVDSTPSDPELLLEEVQSLHERVERMSADQLRRNADALRKEHRELERERNRISEGFNRSQSAGTVDAYLKEIHRILVETSSDR